MPIKAKGKSNKSILNEVTQMTSKMLQDVKKEFKKQVNGGK